MSTLLFSSLHHARILLLISMTILFLLPATIFLGCQTNPATPSSPENTESIAIDLGTLPNREIRITAKLSNEQSFNMEGDEKIMEIFKGTKFPMTAADRIETSTRMKTGPLQANGTFAIEQLLESFDYYSKDQQGNFVKRQNPLQMKLTGMTFAGKVDASGKITFDTINGHKIDPKGKLNNPDTHSISDFGNIKRSLRVGDRFQISRTLMLPMSRKTLDYQQTYILEKFDADKAYFNIDPTVVIPNEKTKGTLSARVQGSMVYDLTTKLLRAETSTLQIQSSGSRDGVSAVSIIKYHVELKIDPVDAGS